MSTATLGLLVGMGLGFAAAFGGFGAFLLVLSLGALGFIIGKVVDGDFSLGDLVSQRGRGRP